MSSAFAWAFSDDAAARWRRPTVAGVLLLWLVAAQVASLSIGRADNGDFTRAQGPYVIKPVGFAANWPALTDPNFRRRFYGEYLPTWEKRLEWNRGVWEWTKLTSAHLLWLPGYALSFIQGGNTFDIEWVSVFQRLLLIGSFAWVLLLWSRGEGPPWLVVPIGLAGWVFGDFAYSSFFNSFSEEGPLVAFAALLFVAAVLAAMQRRTAFAITVTLGTILIATNKSLNALVPLVVAAFLLALWVPWRRQGKPAPRALVPSLALALVVSAGLSITVIAHLGNNQEFQNRYHSIYFGVLPFSSDPATHIARMGYPEHTIAFIGHSVFEPPTAPFAHANQKTLSYGQTLSVLAHEPSIAPKVFWYVLSVMNDVELRYLSMWRAGADPTQTPEVFRLFGHLKNGLNHEPGWNFLLLVSLLIGCSALFLQQRDLLHLYPAVLALASLASAGACILGDGKQEIEKHLFTANLLLDVAVLAFMVGAAQALTRRPQVGAADSQ